MGRMVNPDVLGGSRPKVTQDDIQDGDVALVTIAEFEQGEIDDPSTETGKRAVMTLTFEELGEKALYLNKSDAETLVEKFGKDADKWKGQTVPIEKVNSTYNNKTYPKVHIVPAADWGKYLKPRRSAKKRPAR